GRHPPSNSITCACAYTPPSATSTQMETSPYTVVAGDGNRPTADLQITVTTGGHDIAPPHTDIGTNGNDTLGDPALTVDNILSGGVGKDRLNRWSRQNQILPRTAAIPPRRRRLPHSQSHTPRHNT